MPKKIKLSTIRAVQREARKGAPNFPLMTPRYPGQYRPMAPPGTPDRSPVDTAPWPNRRDKGIYRRKGKGTTYV